MQDGSLPAHCGTRLGTEIEPDEPPLLLPQPQRASAKNVVKATATKSHLRIMDILPIEV